MFEEYRSCIKMYPNEPTKCQIKINELNKEILQKRKIKLMNYFE